MKLRKILFCGFMLFSFMSFVYSDRYLSTMSSLEILTSAINSFSLDTYKQLSNENPDKSIIFSPLLVDMGLSILLLGARGATYSELNRGLHLPSSNIIKLAFNAVINDVHSSKGVTVKCANKIFLANKTYEISPDFQRDALNAFSSEPIEMVNFDHPLDAASIINKWAEEKTDNKIKDLIDSNNSLNSDTVMVLANAIYFKGLWSSGFSTFSTYMDKFHVDQHNKIDIHMMQRTTFYKYADVPELNAKLLEIPYEQKDMSMVIILPNEIDGLKDVESRLKSTADLFESFKRLSECRVLLQLPKFKIENSFHLKNTLNQLNIKKIFEPSAKFYGIIKNKSIRVTDVIQKTFIEVTESGTTAAAATGYILEAVMMYPNDPISFKADHPFIFCIKTKRNIPLFFGKYNGK